MKLLLNVTFTLLLFGSLLLCSCNKEGISWNLPRNNPNDTLVVSDHNNNSTQGEIKISKDTIFNWYSDNSYDYYSLNVYIKCYYNIVVENISYHITTSFVSTLNTNIGGSEFGNIGNINPNEEKLLFNNTSPYNMTLYLRELKGNIVPSNITFNIKITYEVEGIQYTKNFQISI